MTSLLLVAISFVAMEPVTAIVHRCVMHGVGRVLHASHHTNAARGIAARVEANDAYPVMFAAVVMLGFAVGFNLAGWQWLVPIGIGVTLYGAAYALVHDCYVHRRVPVFGQRRFALLDRLAAAHGLHHARGGAPYGMLLPVTGARRSGQRVASVPESR